MKLIEKEKYPQNIMEVRLNNNLQKPNHDLSFGYYSLLQSLEANILVRYNIQKFLENHCKEINIPTPLKILQLIQVFHK